MKKVKLKLLGADFRMIQTDPMFSLFYFFNCVFLIQRHATNAAATSAVAACGCNQLPPHAMNA